MDRADLPIDNNTMHFDKCSIYKHPDGTCVKQAFGAGITRLRIEAECLKLIQGEDFPPKLYEYNKDFNTIRMEYINGLTLPAYIEKYNKIPEWFCKKMLLIFLKLLKHGVEYGTDIKLDEHFIIEEDTEHLRLIDYGISNNLTGVASLVEKRKKYYLSKYKFVIEESRFDDESKNNFREMLYSICTDQEILDKFFNNMELISNDELREYY